MMIGCGVRQIVRYPAGEIAKRSISDFGDLPTIYQVLGICQMYQCSWGRSCRYYLWKRGTLLALAGLYPGSDISLKTQSFFILVVVSLIFCIVINS